MRSNFVDATATARTLHHTGIQRVVRSIVVEGNELGNPVRPIVWAGRTGFRAPTSLEMNRLRKVFRRGLHRCPRIGRVFDWLHAPRRVRWEPVWPHFLLWRALSSGRLR